MFVAIVGTTWSCPRVPWTSLTHLLYTMGGLSFVLHRIHTDIVPFDVEMRLHFTTRAKNTYVICNGCRRPFNAKLPRVSRLSHFEFLPYLNE